MGCCCSANEKLEARIAEHLDAAHIIRKDIFWPNQKYRQNSGCCAVRGNGALVLTYDQLWFTLLCPEGYLSMPLGSIKSVTCSKSFRGGHRYIGSLTPMLVIEYDDSDNGMEDVVVFQVRNAEKWKEAIDAAINVYKMRPKVAF